MVSIFACMKEEGQSLMLWMSHQSAQTSTEFDFIIIGSGFGGAVTAMRMSQKGYRVLILEKGNRFHPQDFPKTNWNVRKFLWAPLVKCFGIQEISLLNSVMVLHGTGFGGGSLVYANTLMQPSETVLKDKEWNLSETFLDRLRKNYALAKKMLGVTKNQLPGPADEELRKLAVTMKAESTYHLTEVGIYFDKANKIRDPYFSGDGPSRNPCTGCGACMIGCRVGAKNTLDKNYLFFAEKWGAKVETHQHVFQIVPDRGLDGLIQGYSVLARKSNHWFSASQTFHGKKVVVASGVLGTLKLLFQNKEKYGTLPHVSEKLGQGVRTNGESLCGATSTKVLTNSESFSTGIAIGSAFHIGQNIKIEPVRYPSGSNAMKLLALPLANVIDPVKYFSLQNSNSKILFFFDRIFKNPAIEYLARLANFFVQAVFKFPRYFVGHWVRDWAKNTIILLVMQSSEDKMDIRFGRSLRTFFRRGLTEGKNSVPSYIPKAQEASEILAKQLDGLPQNIISEVLLKTPATAHILGGVSIGDSKLNSVISEKFEVHDYPGLYVCDGSVIPVNLGVNPSLTITALAETFCEQFKPNFSHDNAGPAVRFGEDEPGR